jgi:hypothetical protein
MIGGQRGLLKDLFGGLTFFLSHPSLHTGFSQDDP